MGTVACGNLYDSCTTMVVVEEIMQLFDVSCSSLVFPDVVVVKCGLKLVKCGLVNEFDLAS